MKILTRTTSPKPIPCIPPPPRVGEGSRHRAGGRLSKGLLILALTLLLNACAIHSWRPVESMDYAVQKDFAIVSSDTLLIAISPQAYRGTAANISSSFFPVWVQVRNPGKKSISLNRSSFGIIADGKQYDFIPIEYILGSLQTDFLLSDYPDVFPWESSTSSSLASNQEKYNDAYFEVLNSYFSFGDLLPGGMKEGYLFYNRRVGSAKQLSIDVLGTRVDFSR